MGKRKRRRNRHRSKTTFAPPPAAAFIAPSIADIAAGSGLTPTEVRGALHELVDRGYLVLTNIPADDHSSVCGDLALPEAVR